MADTENKGPAKAPKRESLFLKRLRSYYKKRPHTVYGVSVGFIVTLAILIIGFWRTLLFIVLICLGYIVGQFIDGDPRIARNIQRFFRRRR